MKVLIVDDNAINRQLLRINLEGEGIEVVDAEDGVDALSKLEEQHADAIISDILMPRMDGYRFCQEVRRHAQLAKTPFIFYTSTYTSSGDEKLALDCGADRYLRKPAPLSDILLALLELSDPDRALEQHPGDGPEEMMVMREYNEALVRKLEERNAKLERARQEILRVNAGLERRVEERTAELMEANAELEAFTHSLAHDLRSPLMAIDGFSNILMKECEGRVPPTAMEHLRYISKATRRMHELTSDLLRLARASRGDIRRDTVDISALAGGILQDLAAARPERQVQTHVQEGLTAEADVALLRIAMENLLGNAWKFTARTAEARIWVGAEEIGDRQFFFVRDNGAGFDMADAPRLFRAFERLHPESEFPGTGIGLTTVLRIIRRHGGQIQGRGAKGEGATFFFDLGATDKQPHSTVAEVRTVS